MEAVMLVLTRKTGERIQIGDDVTLTIVRIDGNKVRIGIEAPTSVKIKRDELPPKVERTASRGMAFSGNR
jgi:carbon storage regulator